MGAIINRKKKLSLHIVEISGLTDPVMRQALLTGLMKFKVGDLEDCLMGIPNKKLKRRDK